MRVVEKNEQIERLKALCDKYPERDAKGVCRNQHGIECPLYNIASNNPLGSDAYNCKFDGDCNDRYISSQFERLLEAESIL